MASAIFLRPPPLPPTSPLHFLHVLPLPTFSLRRAAGLAGLAGLFAYLWLLKPAIVEATIHTAQENGVISAQGQACANRYLRMLTITEKGHHIILALVRARGSSSATAPNSGHQQHGQRPSCHVQLINSTARIISLCGSRNPQASCICRTVHLLCLRLHAVRVCSDASLYLHYPAPLVFRNPL